MNLMSTYRWHLLFTLAAIGFALTAHREAWHWWRRGCFTAIGIALCGGWATMSHPFETTIGTNRIRLAGLAIAAATCLAVPAALGYRHLLDKEPLPNTLRWFALAALMIGAVEELLWRGWLQGNLSKALPAGVAIVLAAGAHTAYKTALFVFPPSGEAVRPAAALALIAGLTLTAGMLLGIVRQWQGTVLGPMGFHMLFDLLVYGEAASAPWWVI